MVGRTDGRTDILIIILVDTPMLFGCEISKEFIKLVKCVNAF